MSVGVFVNCFGGLVGGVLGTVLGKQLSQSLKDDFPALFGLCSIGIGINSITRLPT